MASRFSPRFTSRLWTPLLCASLATAGGITYASLPNRHIPAQAPLLPPTFPKIKTRAEQISRLRRSGSTSNSTSGSITTSPSPDDVYDLLIIGGGATGTGIALDAVTRGLRVALVERDDFSSGTSSKSTKLVHGGVRYLEKAVWNLDYSQYALVKEALHERACFMGIAPHLSSWLPVMLPIQKWYQAPYFWAGTKFYDLLAGGVGNKSSYFLTRGKALAAFPMLREDSLVAALVYYDGQHNDSRMNVSLAMTAALYGATTVNHIEVTALEKDAAGKLCGARVRDLLPPSDSAASDFLIRAKGVINATGPFVDAIHQMDDPSTRPIVAPSQGVHIVLPPHLCPPTMGLIDPSSSDGRVVFLLPWEGHTLAGTTDSACAISANPVPAEADIAFLLAELRRHLSPALPLRRADVRAAWSGIRPLVRDPAASDTAGLVRSHLVSLSKSGLLTCAGGKWTTYRQMAQDTVDAAVRAFDLSPRPLQHIPDISGHNLPPDALLDGSCATTRIRVLGAHGFSAALPAALVQRCGLDADVARHLANSYGDRAWAVAALSTPSSDSAPLGNRLAPGHPFVDGEVRHAVRSEYAQTAVDVLARRTRLAFVDARGALAALPGVVDVMGAELGWGEARREEEWVRGVGFLETMGLERGLWGVGREEVVRGLVGREREGEEGVVVQVAKKRGVTKPRLEGGMEV